MNYEFSSKEELFLRVRPALRAKSNELNKLGYYFVTDVDIWNYLIQVKWTKSKDLMLCDVVHDIFNADNIGVVEFSKDRMEYLKNNNPLNKNVEVV